MLESEGNMKKTWFAVKTFYTQEAKGTPKNKDKDYSKTTAILEERVVLYHVKNVKKAVELAEKDAKKICQKSYKNIYGESVGRIYTGHYDAVELSKKPGDKVVVFGLADVFENKTEMKKAMKVRAGTFHRKKDKFKKRFEEKKKNRDQE
jgi:hypothetical protein